MIRSPQSMRRSVARRRRFASFVSLASRLVRYHPPAKWQYIMLFILLIIGLLLNSVIVQHP